MMKRTYAFKRSDKIAQRIQMELADLFRREVGDPRIGAVTVTGVDVDDELREAQVRVCRFMQGEYREPTAEERLQLEKALKSATPFIFEKLKRRLAIRHTPWIRFRYDDSLAKSARVWALLNHEQNHEPSGPEESSVEERSGEA